MKIAQLLSGLCVPLTNEEKAFVNRHQEVKITSLTERDNWLAQNLVRKGVYTISKDNNTLVKQAHDRS